MKHLKRNILTAALLCSFAAVAGAQTTGSTGGTTATTSTTGSTVGATPGTTTGTSGTTATTAASADVPTATTPNTTDSTTLSSGEHTVLNPKPDTAADDARGSSVAAQARANRGQGQDTAAAVRAANPSSQNAQSNTVAATPNFDTLDINKDGWVSLSELPVGNTTLSSSFAQYDTDGDSRLSRSEFDSLLTASNDTAEMDEDSEGD